MRARDGRYSRWRAHKLFSTLVDYHARTHLFSDHNLITGSGNRDRRHNCFSVIDRHYIGHKTVPATGDRHDVLTILRLLTQRLSQSGNVLKQARLLDKAVGP